MKINQVRLDEKQNAYFDFENLRKEDWENLWKELDGSITEFDRYRCADFGGGAGHFSDKLLERYSQVEIDIYDISKLLLEKNLPSSRKRLIEKSFFEINETEKYDYVFLNFVLHHMVSTDLNKTRNLIIETIGVAKKVLKKDGILVIWEPIISGYISSIFSSTLLYEVTSNRLLKKIIKKLGANTAGVGIYYMGENELLMCLRKCELSLKSKFTGREHKYGYKLYPLIAKNVFDNCYILQKNRVAQV